MDHEPVRRGRRRGGFGTARGREEDNRGRQTQTGDEKRSHDRPSGRKGHRNQMYSNREPAIGFVVYS
ncbi:hypothetical protein FRUB_07601 [Fimbriiglobus ruber]|uniref:Uncharacterized protein n=1 Tax=Fimbriiglobus ruber TaxID=1908690 RepID=A0A225DA93_9BACT|nr:hypothetical protein FRUB_07601 [Fimbriiglobus ruber]